MYKGTECSRSMPGRAVVWLCRSTFTRTGVSSQQIPGPVPAPMAHSNAVITPNFAVIVISHYIRLTRCNRVSRLSVTSPFRCFLNSRLLINRYYMLSEHSHVHRWYLLRRLIEIPRDIAHPPDAISGHNIRCDAEAARTICHREANIPPIKHSELPRDLPGTRFFSPAWKITSDKVIFGPGDNFPHVDYLRCPVTLKPMSLPLDSHCISEGALQKPCS
jgi:hypothetical protein